MTNKIKRDMWDEMTKELNTPEYKAFLGKFLDSEFGTNREGKEFDCRYCCERHRKYLQFKIKLQWWNIFILIMNFFGLIIMCWVI